jgi:uncharacterized repeat protein (TIGR01451 family)
MTVVIAALAAGLFAAPAPHATTAPSATTDASQPLLSIAVDNGRTSVAAGDQLTYKIKVRNLASAKAKQLKITQSLPSGLTFVSADSGGKAGAAGVAWLIDLGAGQESTLTTIAKAGQTPDDLLRLATVACATAPGDTKPLVCATHSDLLPAGARVARTDAPANRGLWFLLGATLLALVAAATVFGRRRVRQLVSRLRRGTNGAVPGVTTAE